MPTIHQEAGLRFRIYVNDHGPPHVHVLASGGEMKIALGGADADIEMVYAVDMTAAERRRAIRITRRSLGLFRMRWKEIHG